MTRFGNRDSTLPLTCTLQEISFLHSPFSRAAAQTNPSHKHPPTEEQSQPWQRRAQRAARRSFPLPRHSRPAARRAAAPGLSLPALPQPLARTRQRSSAPTSSKGGHVILTAGKQRGEHADSPCASPEQRNFKMRQLQVSSSQRCSPQAAERRSARHTHRHGRAPRERGRNALRNPLGAVRARQQPPRPGSPFIRRRPGPYIKEGRLARAGGRPGTHPRAPRAPATVALLTRQIRRCVLTRQDRLFYLWERARASQCAEVAAVSWAEQNTDRTSQPRDRWR